ncbi:uncharacterized protein LOC141628051 [Silene latifolia]|uniref:uncharacterized protein LOC141628051 n=1 Tax=Silene latifolia TaxID=37657 RepID=UPI003D786827
MALLRFLNSGVMLKEWNNTHIVLIPKVENPELVFQYRPISLCNVIYRLDSKCLANRLKQVISSIVSETQQAFVPDRLMFDGCLITHEIMHYINKTKKGTVSYAALKLDMHKAFDRVSWQFLIADLFRCFELASIQMVNPDKSFIKCTPNAPPDFTSHLASILKMKTTNCFGNYLGVPVDLPSKRSTTFHPLLDKMTKRIIAWSALHLSQSCKLLIINSILLGSLKYLLTAIPFPLGICKKIDSLISSFWWRKDMKIKSIHWLSRDSLQLPLENGGLGFKFISLLSQASLMKNFWRIHHHQAATPALSDMLSMSANWDHREVFRVYESSCAKVILAMEPPHIDIDDFLYWKFTEDGVYTVRSGYSFLLSQHSFSCSPSFFSAFPWKFLWGIHSSTKLPLLIWRIVHNILPSLDNLSRRGMQAIWLIGNSVIFEDLSVNPVQIMHLSEYLFVSHSQLPVFWPPDFTHQILPATLCYEQIPHDVSIQHLIDGQPHQH